jgi:hypothetical protein
MWERLPAAIASWLSRYELSAVSYELLCLDLFGFFFYIRFYIGNAFFEIPDAFADPGTDLGEFAGPENDHH